MKAKILTALILDNTPESRKMGNAIKEIFTSVHLEDNRDSFVEEFKRIKPNVLFVSLEINQRATNFELLEKLRLTAEDNVVIFGYNDSLEQELAAHALENGFQDIFVRPYEAEIIATKVNLFYKFDKSIDKGLAYTKLPHSLKASVTLSLRFIGLDENGMNFKSIHYINKGIVLNLQYPLIQEIFGVPSIEMMVTKTWTDDETRENFLFMEPWNATEQSSAALRRFILSKVKDIE